MVSGTTGLVCHSEKATDWANAVISVLRDPPRRQAMVHAAREYALTRQWSESLQPLYRAYRDVRAPHVTEAPRDVLALPVV